MAEVCHPLAINQLTGILVYWAIISPRFEKRKKVSLSWNYSEERQFPKQTHSFMNSLKTFLWEKHWLAQGRTRCPQHRIRSRLLILCREGELCPSQFTSACRRGPGLPACRSLLCLCGLFVVRVDLFRKASSAVLAFTGLSLWSLGTDWKNSLGSSFLCDLCYQFWDTFSISKSLPIDPFRLFSLEHVRADVPPLWLKLLPILHHLWLFLLSDIFISILEWKCYPFVWLPQTSYVFYDLHFSLSYPFRGLPRWC